MLPDTISPFGPRNGSVFPRRLTAATPQPQAPPTHRERTPHEEYRPAWAPGAPPIRAGGLDAAPSGCASPRRQEAPTRVDCRSLAEAAAGPLALPHGFPGYSSVGGTDDRGAA